MEGDSLARTLRMRSPDPAPSIRRRVSTSLQLKGIRLLQRRRGHDLRASRPQLRTRGRTDQGAGLQGLGHTFARLKDEEGLASLAQFHGEVLLGAIDAELDLLLVGAEQAPLAEADVEGAAGETAVVLLDDDDVDRAGEGGGVDAVPRGAHAAGDAAHVLHGGVAVVPVEG